MKNFSKNNYSEKNSNNNKKNSNSKNKFLKNSSFSDKNKSNLKNRSQGLKSLKSNELNQMKLNDKRDRKIFTSQRKAKSERLNNEYFSNNNKINYSQSQNKKNFDDWIWGKHSVYAALTSDRPINRIWCTSEIFSSEKFYIPLKDHKSKGVLVEEVSWNRITQLTFGAAHQGIAIQIAYSESLPLKKLIDLSKVNSSNPIILALDGITDPHNLGAIIRSAEAFDCKGIVIPQRRSSGLTGTVAKVAAGALEHIPISRVVNLNRALEELKRNGFLTIGLSGDGQMPISKFLEKTPLVVIIGAEDKGISLLSQKKCDYLLKIPLRGKTSSLNASVAAAISLFHLTNT
tara:strand:- start:115 stop:1149 length:1035 start_codon:yes stop_codon:yes gene_type:complete